jgi:hypothetical protein
LVDAVVSLLGKPRRHTPPSTIRDRDDSPSVREI